MSFHHAGHSKASLISSFVQGFPEVDQALDFLITQYQVNGEATLLSIEQSEAISWQPFSSAHFYAATTSR